MFGNNRNNGDGRDYLVEGMWHGAEIRAGREHAKAVVNEELFKEWQGHAETLKRKLETVAAERDAAMEVIEAVVNEEKEIMNNPDKQRFFSDPNNRFSRTNLFHRIKDEKKEEYSKLNSSKIPEEVLKK